MENETRTINQGACPKARGYGGYGDKLGDKGDDPYQETSGEGGEGYPGTGCHNPGFVPENCRVGFGEYTSSLKTL